VSIPPVYAGIDVSKAHLDIYDPERGPRRIANTTPALTAWAATLPPGRFVVLEATSHYDTLLRRRLEKDAIAFARVNPERARDFARALGRRAKTDPIDARMLAAQEAVRLSDGDPNLTEAIARHIAWLDQEIAVLDIASVKSGRMTTKPSLSCRAYHRNHDNIYQLVNPHCENPTV